MASFLTSRLSKAQQGLCPVDTVAAFVNVCLSQSCGKCTPCRVGLKKLGEIYDRILDGDGSAEDIAL
ncbi:MAG: glutamate synthase, partial [Clostridia bacterium]|nr:glutamate synthase [Clostridia bacterium]